MNKLKNNNIVGGGIFGGKKKFNYVLKNTKKSETKFINAYEDMDKQAKKYNNAYIKHMNNLKIVDDYVNFNGMETLFTKVIMQDNFIKGHIDKTNPLLFRNYIINGEVLPSTFRIEHLMNQIRYVMNKSILGRDQSFIKYISITDISKNDFVVNIVTIDNIKQKKVIPHSDFLIDKDKTKKFIMDVVSSTMKKLKRSSLIAEYDEDDVDYRKKSSKHRTKSKRDNLNNSIHKTKSSKSNSESIIKLSTIKHSKTNKPVRKEKMTEYLAPYEQNQRIEREKAEKNKQQAEIKKVLDDKQVLILGSPQTDIVQAGQKHIVPESDPIKAKCEAYGYNKTACLADKPDCFVDKQAGLCWKSTKDYQKPQKPQLVTKPGTNPFNIQQKEPQILI